MEKIFDIIIIGAGIIGCSIAYHLQKNNPKKSILLIDQNSRVGLGNTAKSAALYRSLFLSSINQELATSSIAYYESIEKDIHLKKLQYLWLFSKNQWHDLARFTIDKKHSSWVFTQNDINKIININNKVSSPTQDIYAGILCEHCGSLSALALTSHYAQQFQSSKGYLQLNTHISTLNLSGKNSQYAPWDDIKLQSVQDTQGNHYKAQNFVFTVGAWTHDLLSSIGIFSGCFPQKQQLFGLKIPQFSKIYPHRQNTPVAILPTGGMYIKPVPSQNMLLIGCAQHLGHPLILGAHSANIDYYMKAITPVLYAYFPSLTKHRPRLAWAGYYSIHWPDKHPVIETQSNITWVAGTSGSGIMKADALGRLTAAKLEKKKTAELYTHKEMVVDTLSLKNRNVPIETLII